MIATGNQDSTIQFWNSATGQIVSTLQPSQSGPTFTVAWKPGNNHLLASGGDEQPIIIWDVTTHQPLLTRNDLPQNYTALTWSPDGTKILAVNEGGTFIICGATTSTPASPTSDYVFL